MDLGRNRLTPLTVNTSTTLQLILYKWAQTWRDLNNLMSDRLRSGKECSKL
jgi:hypothetical protein